MVCKDRRGRAEQRVAYFDDPTVSVCVQRLFYCEGLSRPERSQKVLNTERVWVIVLCNFRHTAVVLSDHSCRPVNQSDPHVKLSLPSNIIIIMSLHREFSLSCSMYRFNCDDSFLEQSFQDWSWWLFWVPDLLSRQRSSVNPFCNSGTISHFLQDNGFTVNTIFEVKGFGFKARPKPVNICLSLPSWTLQSGRYKVNCWVC